MTTNWFQNRTRGKNKLCHFVEQVILYRTAYVTFLVHSTFSLIFLKHSSSLRQHENSTKTSEFFLIPIDSDAVSHEESEYHIGFMIWASYHSALSSFLKRKQIFFEKKTKMMKSILHVLQGRWRPKSNFFLPKWSAQKALQTLKVSSNLKQFSVWTWRLLVDTPIYIYRGVHK